YGNFDYISVLANVIDDDVYNTLKKAEKRTVYLFNLESGDGDLIYSSLLNKLRSSNKNNSLWSNEQLDFHTRDSAETLKPIYKAERHDEAFQITGILFFSVMFLGILFLISSIVVLYYKITTDIEDEKEQIEKLNRIGLTTKECKAYLQTHLKILF
ncbi:MAG TPA: ABC transporter permease, partial [Firmicutes bacterium]|nr:ABC transporter permease [Bacillota bacterium]